MPDGDIVHPTLSARYNNVYKQVCESTSQGDTARKSAAFEEDLAREALKSLKADVKGFGDEPIQLIEREAAFFNRIVEQLQQQIDVDWRKARRDIQDLAQQFVGSKRALQLVVRACLQQLQILQVEQNHGQHFTDFSLPIAQGYILNIYDAQFASKAEQTRSHYNQASPEAVRSVLSDIRPLVIRGIAAFSDQMIQQGHAHTLRLPPRKNKLRKIDLARDIDLDLSEIL